MCVGSLDHEHTKHTVYPTLELAWVPVWFPASPPEHSSAMPQPPVKQLLGTHPVTQQIKAKARHCSPPQTLASLKIDPLHSPKLLGKYFPFKMTLYGEGETFCKQHLLIPAGLASAAPSQISAISFWPSPFPKLPAALWQIYKPPSLPLSEGISPSPLTWP